MAKTAQTEIIADGLMGGMDTRSESGSGEAGTWRLLLNIDGRERRTLCRLGGWIPYGGDHPEGICNRDLHDQMLAAQTYALPVTYHIEGSSSVIGYDYAGIYYVTTPASRAGMSLGDYCGNSQEAPFPVGFFAGPYIANSRDGYPYTYTTGPAGSGVSKINWYQRLKCSPKSAFEDAMFCLVSYESVAWGPGTVQSEVIRPPNQQPGQIQIVHVCLPEDATNLTVFPEDNTGVTLGIPQGTPFPEAPRTVCEAPPAGTCTTGAPYFYQLPAYTMGYGFVYPGSTGGPYYGAPVPIYSDVNGYQYVVASEETYLWGFQQKEAITLLHPVSSTGGNRKLIAATRSRIYVGDELEGNWQIIADGLGGPCHRDDDATCSETRFTAGTIGNATLFGNGIDPVLVWNFSTTPNEISGWSAEYVPELLQMGVNTAAVVANFGGFIFLGDMKVNGEWLHSRIQWSDYNDPLAWIPGSESLAAFHDFGHGEIVINILTIGGRLRVYTDQAIYDGQLVADERVFQFTEIYRGKLVPIARHAMVSTGDAHFFLGAEGIYRIAEYDREPVQLDWIRAASGVIFGGIKHEWVQSGPMSPTQPWNLMRCRIPTAGWSQKHRCLWFSWATGESPCPDMSLLLFTDYQKSSLVDYGFTAFAEWAPDTSKSWRQELAEAGVCPTAEFLGPKEGMPCTIEEYPYGYYGPPYDYLWNETENPDLPMGPNAFFGRYCNVCLDDLCKSCESDSRFLMASASDKAIKEFTPTRYSRWELVGDTKELFPKTSAPTYEERGYLSMLQTHETRSGTEKVKTMRGVVLTYQAAYQTTPGLMYSQAGGGETPYCLEWEDVPPENLDCVPELNRRAQSQMRWGFYTSGIHHAIRFWVEGTGSQFCLSGMAVKMTAVQDCW